MDFLCSIDRTRSPDNLDARIFAISRLLGNLYVRTTGGPHGVGKSVMFDFTLNALIKSAGVY